MEAEGRGSTSERLASGGWGFFGGMQQQSLRKAYFISKNSFGVNFANSTGRVELESVSGARPVPRGRFFPLDTPAAWQTAAPTLVESCTGRRRQLVAELTPHMPASLHLPLELLHISYVLSRVCHHRFLLSPGPCCRLQRPPSFPFVSPHTVACGRHYAEKCTSSITDFSLFSRLNNPSSLSLSS